MLTLLPRLTLSFCFTYHQFTWPRPHFCSLVMIRLCFPKKFVSSNSTDTFSNQLMPYIWYIGIYAGHSSSRRLLIIDNVRETSEDEGAATS